MRAKRRQSDEGDDRAAALRLLDTYAGLARRGAHLLDALLLGQAPKQWAHYPEDDAVDRAGGFQWFYHSHAPENRRGATEHGHIHLFARRKRWSRRLGSKREAAFARLPGGTEGPVDTRHLLAMGLDAKGLPVSLFTVNSWVTGDLMLSAETTASLLEEMALDTGYGEVDAVIGAVMWLYRAEIRDLLERRDRALRDFDGANVLSNESLEVLSALAIDVDARLQAMEGSD